MHSRLTNSSVTVHRRRMAQLVCLLYAMLSIVLPFMHSEYYAPLRVRHSAGSVPRHSHAGKASIAAADASSPDHCIACEWQAANVSAALAPFAFIPAAPAPIASLAPIEHACESASFSPASRGPPQA